MNNLIRKNSDSYDQLTPDQRISYNNVFCNEEYLKMAINIQNDQKNLKFNKKKIARED